MSLIQSHSVKHKSPPNPQAAGIVGVAIFKHDFTTTFTAADDLLEIGILPAYAQIISATEISLGLGAITADIGLMDGQAGQNDETRTAGVELFDDQSVNNTEVAAAVSKCLAVAPASVHRGIGVALSGNVAAGANKSLTLVVSFVY